MGSPDGASIVLIDGEHYPAVVARAVAWLGVSGQMPALALMVGGREKLGQAEAELPIPVELADDDPESRLASAIDRTGARLVIDISDEPVLGYVARCRMASVAIWKGAVYRGADFLFQPPPRPPLAEAPSVAIVGTGKRSGKTSVGGAAARAFRDAGLKPVVVAMGRGGPPEPEVLEEGVDLSPKALYEFVKQGRHAASDYIEDALTARVPTVGAWRAGGGMAGGVSFGNYPAAMRAAAELDPGLLVLEGSGAAVPPAGSDAGILVVDSRADPALLCGYFGLYRVLLADLVVMTMCEASLDPRHIAEVQDCISSCSINRPKVVRTVFRPHPLGDISGKRIWLATTASKNAAEVLEKHLTESWGAQVLGTSHALADREQLRQDLTHVGAAEVLLVELKAAAVDVATRYGIENGIEVVYLDNRPEPAPGEQTKPEPEFLKVAEFARQRFANR